jgi:hypothetical protein
MKKISTILTIVFLLVCLGVIAQNNKGETITAEYGPPAEANVWTQFTIPLTAETFAVDESVLDAVLANVNSFWIRTEMHTGEDIGGIDDVYIGTTYFSDFNASSDGWSSGGDGTMEWMTTGGYEGGFLQISDWATGDWHWLISPASWAGDWSSLKGQDITFWYQTNRPSYSAIIKITSDVNNRLVINTVVSNTILPDDSVRVELEVFPPPGEEIEVNITSSDNNCINVPSQVSVPAGISSVEFYIKAAADASIGCQSVIEAKYSNFITSRITMQVLDNYGIQDIPFAEMIIAFPNPCNGKFTLSNASGKKIQQVCMYDLSGNVVLRLEEKDLSNIEIDVRDQASSIYFLRVIGEDDIMTTKIVIE